MEALSYCCPRTTPLLFPSTAPTFFTSNGRAISINRSTTHSIDPTHHTTNNVRLPHILRRAIGTTTRNTTTLIKPLAAQPFSMAASRQASGETEGKNPDSTHATRKKDQLDVQSANSKEARE
jgi:hypothetical protein